MSKIKIFFLTYPEHGEANSMLAVIQSVQEKYKDQVDIHLGSFELLRSRAPHGVTFHPIPGQPLGTFGRGRDETLEDATRSSATYPGFLGATAAYRRMLHIFYGKTVKEAADRYISITFEAQQVLEDVKPDFAVVNALFEQGRDAAHRAKIPWVLLSPLGLRDNSFSDQGANIFNWPAIATGYHYPVKGLTYFLNLMAQLFLPLWIFVLDPFSRKLCAERNKAGIEGPLPLLGPRRVPVVCMGTLEAEYPGVVPNDVILCGPIIQKSELVEKVDPELAKWLEGKLTVLIVLGSHWCLTKEEAHNVLHGCRELLKARPDLQVLWKLQKFPAIDYELGNDLDDRIRIVDWLKPDPLAIMQTGRVVCFVNHGGSNSYHEGLAMGVPQIIMSIWYDTHDFAAKAEWLEVGKWGNRKNAPSNSAAEFTEALLSVVGNTPTDKTAAKYATRAKEVSDIVCRRANGGTGKYGRELAAEYVWAEAQKAVAKKD